MDRKGICVLAAALLLGACSSQPVRNEPPPAPPPPSPDIGVSDTDSDGVADRDDHCPDSEAGVAVDAEGCPMASTTATPPTGSGETAARPSHQHHGQGSGSAHAAGGDQVSARPPTAGRPAPASLNFAWLFSAKDARPADAVRQLISAGEVAHLWVAASLSRSIDDLKALLDAQYRQSIGPASPAQTAAGGQLLDIEGAGPFLAADVDCQELDCKQTPGAAAAPALRTIDLRQRPVAYWDWPVKAPTKSTRPGGSVGVDLYDAPDAVSAPAKFRNAMTLSVGFPFAAAAQDAHEQADPATPTPVHGCHLFSGGNFVDNAVTCIDATGPITRLLLALGGLFTVVTATASKGQAMIDTVRKLFGSVRPSA
ncbi:hypothetical protein [Solimonas terrae]|uniref:Uncharacterized protein n=1 Tax=Solimonas terrae TaxID=1396819 RepID=A0A6M2BQD2_9GAMM|nr:hypothetical protein [Solimonas terrae]NGY04658.1 hypothetical protein [Solimonas terrae]